MILVENESWLPAEVQAKKAAVLAALGEFHAVRDFTTVAELAQFLDQLLVELAAIEAPRGLTRVILFSRNRAAVTAVATRMLPGGDCLAFDSPRCWSQLAADLDKLKNWAAMRQPTMDAKAKGI